MLDPVPDDNDHRAKKRRELLLKALADFAPAEGEPGVGILEKMGRIVKEASSADDALKALGDIAELMLPGTLNSWARLKTAALTIASQDGFRAVVNNDPVLVPAVRIIQAVLVAVEKRDAERLREWERRTLAYMMDEAPEDYVRLPIPPRAKIDRHIVLGVVLRRIKELLHDVGPTGGIMEIGMFAMLITALIHATFPHLHEVEGLSITGLVSERYPKHVEKYGSPKDIDPEAILTDALEALGVPRKTVQQSWLKGVKY